MIQQYTPRDIPKDLYARLQAEANRRGMTIDELAREAVESHLDQAAFIRRRVK